MNKIIITLIVLFALNCKSTENQSKIANNDLVLIAKGNLYGSGSEGIEKQSKVIKTKSDWNNLMAKMNAENNVSNTFSETDIDFSKYLIIAVFDAIKSSGGHSLELNLKTNSDKIIVEIIRNAPKGMATTVVTQPYYIAKMPKSDKPIQFE